ncbi:MAG: hypothetical protein FJW36_20930 [Acidobacteria bacterium]|nr:hypothetical protein [Acidobacteriota bacterium]
MKIKSFYADTMDLALQNAGRELGDEALILNTREAPKEFRHFGKYEVVCAVAAEPTATQPTPGRTEKKPARDGFATSNARMLFLVGPSGVGKSSSCAKIAIHAKFNQGQNPAVVSWDTGRVGGADYLRAYCEIAGVPFREADSAEAFNAALSEFADAGLVIVDTPALEGASPAQQEILRVLGEYPEAETHLVLSSTLSPAYLAASYAAYAAYRPAFFLPTHLDEARMDLATDSLGSIRNLTIQWCGTGRAIPEDIEDAGQVIQKAAAFEAPAQIAHREPEYAIAAIASPAPQVPSPVSPKTAIDSILARFRRTGPDLRSHSLNPSKSSAA